MTENRVPGAPPPPPTGSAASTKKGLPAIAWVAIGCGVLLLLALVVMMAGGMFMAKKFKDVAEDFEENPALATAEMAVRLNPELELVESDHEAGTLKVRNKETGEVMVFDASDINEGRITFGKEGEEATVTFGGDEGEGTLTVQGPEGETRFRAGAANLEDLPGWVPVPSGATPQGAFSSTTAEGVSGSVTLTTDESLDDTAAFYERALEDAGFEVEKTSYSAGGMEARSFQGTSEDGKRTVTVGVTQEDGQVQVVVHYSDET